MTPSRFRERICGAVTLPALVIDALAARVGRHADDELMFVGPEGGTLRSRAWRSRVWVPAVKRADLEPLRFHDLRHTAVALAIAAGAHPQAIAERMGHSSITTTHDRYGHLFPSIDEQLAERLDGLARTVRG